MVAEDDKTSKDKEIDKLMDLISLSFKKIYNPTNNNLRTSSNISRANQNNSPRINKSTGYENQRIGNVDGARETRGNVKNRKRVKDAAYHMEKMLLCKQKEAGIQLNVEQVDWRDDTDDELEDQELEAHYMYMAKLQEVSPDAADSGPIFDAEPLEQIDQNDDDADLVNESPESDEVIRLEKESQSKLKLEVDSLRSQLETQKTQFLNEIDRLSREYYYADHMNAILGVYTELDEDLKAQLQDKGIVIRVIPTTSVSRPQLKSNPMGDRVMRNNSQGQKQDVEDHRRNVKFSKNKTSVTACNDSLKAKTLNVNFMCATCGKCVLNEKHDMCVLKYVNDVNSRTKLPIAMPVSTREPKCTVKQSIAKPIRKTVDSESNQKPGNITRKLYERVRK
nr:hypothetical protein [Tanacetum cinerariifolium]